MPDLGTHVMMGYWLRRFVFLKSNGYLSIFLLGCILPDMIFKTGEVLLPHDIYWLLKSYHSPFSLLFQCIGISLLFSGKIRLAVFNSLIAGVVSHLFLDSLQSHLTNGVYFWLFPFSNWTWEFGLFPVHIWPYLLAGSIMLVLFSHLLQRWIVYNRESHD
jgi:hypothetical protein